MRRGDVYWASLTPRSGSEQTGRRPVVVISHDALNEIPSWRSIVVLPMSTSATQAKLGPIVVPVPAGAGGLTRPGLVLCHQVTTLDRSKLVKKIGTLPPALVGAIELGLKAALDLD